MLRLDLEDRKSIVVFIDPMNNIMINKESRYGLRIKTSSDEYYAEYYSVEDRDAAYDYVLNKINEYLTIMGKESEVPDAGND